MESRFSSNDLVKWNKDETRTRSRTEHPDRPGRLFESKVFNPNGLLVEVPNTQKPYLPEMYRAKPLEASEVAEDAEDEEE